MSDIYQITEEDMEKLRDNILKSFSIAELIRNYEDGEEPLESAGKLIMEFNKESLSIVHELNKVDMEEEDSKGLQPETS